jgi:hypothetical protein
VPEENAGSDDWLGSSTPIGTIISIHKHELYTVRDKDEESYYCHHRIENKPSHKHSGFYEWDIPMSPSNKNAHTIYKVK